MQLYLEYNQSVRVGGACPLTISLIMKNQLVIEL